MTTTYQPFATQYPHEIPEHKVNVLPLPLPGAGNEHAWVCTAVFLLSRADVDRAAAAWMAGVSPEPLLVHHDNLASLDGPQCIKCGQMLTPETHGRPCPVVLGHTPGCGHHHHN